VIIEYLNRLEILPQWCDRHVVVLWGRISREIHVSANSSTLAIAQLARLCLDAKLGVILAGDINFEKLRTYDKTVMDHAICIGQFWKEYNVGPGRGGKLRHIPDMKMVEPKLAARPDQVRLFYVLGKYLKSAGKRLVHVGT
jgi:hypothetical protein